jgi:DNA-binding winged helix-turn-helix (wHTH) protein
MNEPQLQIYEFDEFRVDAAKRLLMKGDGEQIPLTPKVFDTLLYLVRYGGKVIEKDELMREIWTDSIVEENNLNQNISILRRVFGEKPGEQRFIITIAGHGYRFVPEIREIANGEKGRKGEAELSEAVLTQVGRLTALENYPRINPTEHNLEKQDEKSGRLWLATVVGSILIGLFLLGFYYWQRNAKLADTPIKTVAVLPFNLWLLKTETKHWNLE